MNCVDHIITLYNEYKKYHNIQNNYETIWNCTISDNILNVEFKKELIIDNDTNSIDSVYDKYKVIQLRSLNNERTLIIGCGNNPIFNGNNLLKKDYESDILKMESRWQNYSKKHEHLGCYTINPDLGMNPSIVGQFGIDDFKFLPEGCFDQIIFEGFLLYCTKDNFDKIYSNTCTINNILYLLKDGGLVEKKYKKINGCLQSLFRNDLIIKNEDCVDSYYQFYKGLLIR